MRAANFVQGLLDCASWQQAQRAADHLLGLGLIQRAELIAGTSGVRVVIEATRLNFSLIEAEILALHNFDYKQFALQKATSNLGDLISVGTAG